MTITGNTLPSTTTGKYPIDRNSDAAKIDPNPNGIQANDYTLTIPKNPKPADQPSPVSHGAIGVMTNGGLLFSTLDGKGKDANKYEVQDNNVGHPSEAQHYHAHKVPPVLYEKQDKTGPSPVLGRALDGYPIVAAYKANGELYSTKELDKFDGREVEVKQEDGTVKKQWAYCVSLDYPYTIGAFKGTPSKIEGLREPSPPSGKPGDGKPGDGKPGDKQNVLPTLDITDEKDSGKNGEHKTARLETTLYDIAKKSLSEINQNNGPASSDSIYRELNRIMVLNGYQSADLDGKQNITDRNLPSTWNNVSKNQEFKLFDGGSNSHKHKAKPVAEPASTTGDPLRLPTGVAT